MIVLGFDTTSPRVTVGIADGNKPVGRWDDQGGRRRGAVLDRLIERALTESGFQRENIDGLALVTGPGSLTATRIGWATASGWALSVGIPVTGWSVPDVQWRWWLEPGEDGQNRLRVEPGSETTVFCLVHHRGDSFYAYHLTSLPVFDPPVVVSPRSWIPPGRGPVWLLGPALVDYRQEWLEALGQRGHAVAAEDAVIGGDRLALWGVENLRDGRRLSLDDSPLNYGLPPTFRKVS